MPSAITLVQTSKDLKNVPSYVTVDIPSISPSVAPRTFPSENSISLKTFVPISSTSRYPIQSNRNKPSMLPPVVTLVDPYGDPSSVLSYITSVNTSRSPSEQQVGAIQEESWTRLGKIKSLETLIASGEIKVYEAAQSRESYIMKLKRDISMLETNVKKNQRKKTT